MKNDNADIRIEKLLAHAGNTMTDLPELSGAQDRCSAYLMNAYDKVYGDQSPDNPIDGMKMMEASALYGVRLVDIIDRLEWALDSALLANKACAAELERIKRYHRTDPKHVNWKRDRKR